MNNTVFAGFGVCVLALMMSPAAAIDRKGTVGDFATELEPVKSCTMGEAQDVLESNDVKLVVNLPSTVNEMRFLGVLRQTGDMVGASVATLGCGLQVVTDIGTKRPWCEYLPFKADRCPSSFSRN